MSNRVIVRNGVMYQWVPNTVGWAQAMDTPASRATNPLWAILGLAGVAGVAYLLLKKRR